MGFTVKKGSEKGLRRGSEKGVSRRCLECPLGEYSPLGVRPISAPPMEPSMSFMRMHLSAEAMASVSHHDVQ